jgi:hypothetical protein
MRSATGQRSASCVPTAGDERPRRWRGVLDWGQPPQGPVVAAAKVVERRRRWPRTAPVPWGRAGPLVLTPAGLLVVALPARPRADLAHGLAPPLGRLLPVS